jgi:hypothetical protein
MSDISPSRLYDYLVPTVPRRPGAALAARSKPPGRVVDDWLGAVPVTAREIDVYEAHFGGVLDHISDSESP